MKGREERAVREICKRKLRWTEALLVTFLITGGLSFAAPLQAMNVSTDTQIPGGTQEGVYNGAFLSVGGGATGTIQGNLSYDVKEQADSETGVYVTGGNLVSANTLDIKVQPNTGIEFSRPKGLIVRSQSDSKIENLNVDVTLASERDADRGSPDSNAAYGVAVGYGWNGGSPSETAKLTVNNANIHVSNTEATVNGNKTVSRSIWGIPITAKVIFGHQLSGLKVYRNGGAAPEFISNGNVNIHVEDKSTAKSGDYLVGVYASGKDAKVTFNGDTNIKVVGKGINSAGIKIGKPVEGDAGTTVTANGKLVVDTTETKDSAAVRLFTKDSKFVVSGANTTEASEIKSANSAIVFDTQDYKTTASVTLAGKIETSRNENNLNSEVELKNTVLSTTSTDASLIKAKAEVVKDQSAGQQGQFSNQLTHGNFHTENAKFTLSGEKSLATAPENGWLVEVQGQANNYSDLVVNIEDKAKVVGQIHKDLSSSLTMNVDNSTWELRKKGVEISTANNVNLTNGAVLDAREISSATQAELDSAVAAAQKELTAANKIKNSFWDPEPEDQFNARKQKAIDEATAKLNQATDLAAKGPQNRAEYMIKLTSDGTVADGTLTNAGTITLANDRYNDELTIAGNYVGQNGEIKMNTEWNGPGDNQGSNSQSDVLHIKGKATGSTTVIPVKADGTENVIDGSIGDIAADLNTRTVAVIKVDDDTAYNSRSFVGTANTTGAGEIQLAERRNPDGTREHYWTLTALNPEDPVPPVVPPVTPKPNVPEVGTPIYAQAVSGYVQMPRANMNLAYDTLRTLHERKGENQILTWEHFKKYQQVAEGQVWVRLLGNRTLDYGKTRFNMEAKNKGFQLGKEFSIQRDDEGKHIVKGGYLSFQESRLSFEDRYRAQNGVIVEDKYTGAGRTKGVSLGLTRTSYTQDGEYLDLVGQLSYFNNKYSSRDNISARNHAWGLTLSAEYGKPYEFHKNAEENTAWLIEPQAQLIYQYMNFSSFRDKYRSVDQDSRHGLRGRLGLRLAYNDYEVKERKAVGTWYGIANLWHDFTNGSEARIGRDHLSERYARTLGEIGLGLQVPIETQSYLYADIRYARALGSIRHREYRGTIGLKYTF